MSIKLADLRAKKKITQRELARELDISNSTVAMYETGDRTPSLMMAKRIARYFGVSVEEIHFGERQPKAV